MLRSTGKQSDSRNPWSQSGHNEESGSRNTRDTTHADYSSVFSELHISPRALLLLLLLLLLLMACVPSRHRVRLASATDLPGTVDSVDRGSVSVVPKISSRACRVPGQSSQCFSVYGAWLHLGQLGSTVLSIKCLYA